MSAPLAFTSASNTTLAYNSFGPGQLGMKFTVGPAALIVRSLGRWVVSGNSQSHALTLYDGTGTGQLATCTVNLSGATPNTFVYAALPSPVILQANTSYCLVSAETSGGDFWRDGSAYTISHAAVATVVASALIASGSPIFNGSTTDGCYGPMSFLYSFVPPPNLPAYFLPTSGQSLAQGAEGNPALTTTPSDGPLYQPDGGLVFPSSFTALVKQVENSSQESFLGAMLRQCRAMVGADLAEFVVANFSQGSTGIAGLTVGSTIFDAFTTGVDNFLSVAPNYAGGPLSVPLVPFVHGENDMQSATYYADLQAFQAVTRNAIVARTRQAGEVPLLMSQPSSWTSVNYIPPMATGKSPYAILQASLDFPTRFLCVCAKYQFAHASDYGVHLINTAYRWLGEYYGKALYRYFYGGGPVNGLQIASATRVGAVITLTFANRVGSLALDTSVVNNPGNYGFEWAQTGGTARTISAVALVNANTAVQITLSGDPGATTAERVRYAYTGVVNNSGGPTTGPRGCLRDSDPAVGTLSGNALYNYAVHQDIACTAAVAPVITSPAAATIKAGQAVSLQIQASGNPTAWSAPGLPTGVNIDATTGLISGTSA